jgi:hypothetical protein
MAKRQPDGVKVLLSNHWVHIQAEDRVHQVGDPVVPVVTWADWHIGDTVSTGTMSDTEPVVVDLETIHRTLKALQDRSCIDFALVDPYGSSLRYTPLVGITRYHGPVSA